MHITGITVADFPPFTEEVKFELDERVNVFMGPNASGKSTILRALQYRMEMEFEGRFGFELSDDWHRVARRRIRPINRGSNNNQANGEKEFADFIPWIYFPASRLTLPFEYDISAMQKLQSQVPIILDDEGEEIEPEPLDAMRESLSLYAFEGSAVHRYAKGVTDLVRSGRKNRRYIERAESEKKLAYDCVQSICSDILVPGHIPSDFIYPQPVVEDELSITNVHDDMAINTIDRNAGSIFMGDLSSGTQGTLLWIWFLAIELANFSPRPRVRRWHEQPSILLIDEIENHLHPTWQRRVIPALLEHFPGLQIFATTHSPFVVAGLKAGQVHLLNRDANGVITATTNTEDIMGWTADEILRTMMGVQDPTDDATAAAARELRQLRDEGPRPEHVDEEQRRERMQELRQLVDRDLLAGGPMAARRELFEQQFAAALEKHRQRQELNQDNG